MYTEDDIKRLLAGPNTIIGKVPKKERIPSGLKVPVVGFDPERARVKKVSK